MPGKNFFGFCRGCVWGCGMVWGMKLNDKLIEQVVGMVSLGLSPQEAALSCGVSRSSFGRWWRRGEAEATSGDVDLVGSVYARFFREVWGAKVGLDLKVMENFLDHHLLSKTDWRAYSWWLSKRLPDDFGEKVGAKDGSGVFAEAVELVTAARAEIGKSTDPGVTD